MSSGFDMRRWLLGAALALASLFLVGPAAADCKPPEQPVIKITMNAPPVAQDQKWSRAGILKYMRSRGQTIRQGYDSVLGITESDIQPSARLQYLGVRDRNGTYCVFLQSATVVIDWKVTVHIASEYKPGSCMYKAIDEHEQGHVAIVNASKDEAQAMIRKVLESTGQKTLVASSMNQGATQLQTDAQAAFEKAFKKFHDALQRRQLGHDTPEEYAKPRKLCGNAYNQ